jgi:diguanylate cyclase (GGDEF)-like protein
MTPSEKTPRITIGVLIGFHIYEGSHPTAFSFPIIRGIQTAARDTGNNLMVACGVARGVGPSRHRPAWAEIDPEMDFVPVGPWNTDGLIFVGPLRNERRIRYVRALIDRGFPAVIIGGDAGKPAVAVDNEGGIRQTMEHLVNCHHHRSIAFIAGDEQDAGDSVVRIQSFRRGQGEFGLNADARLIESGGHWDEGGYQAMRRILQSGVEFTAVMCSNDQSALGAVRALHEARKRIPWDVAVTGFDDIQESQALVPPLTSVHYPLFETGYRALLLLQKRIEQGPEALPDMTRVTTWLIPRQSCGCLPEMVMDTALAPEAPAAEGAPVSDRTERIQLMVDAFMAASSAAPEADLVAYCGQLTDGFEKSLADGDYSHFQSAFSDILQHVEIGANDNADVWQSVVSALRRIAYAGSDGRGSSQRLQRVEDLLHQGRTMISESADRRYTRLQVTRTHRDEEMGLLTARLISVSDEAGVYEALREDLPRIGVRSCKIVFFDPRGEDPVAASVLHPLEQNSPPLQFETRRFPPPGLYPDEPPFNLALLPLFFQEEKLGYIAFDGENLDPLATLVRQLASSIKNAQLHAKVLDLSLTDELTGVHNRRYFEILLQKETERSRRYKRDLAVIMLDIDLFKTYNDTFGHPAGDDALHEIASSLERGARRGLDVVTRYGGEEFAIILPETDAAGAHVVAENVRRLVEQNRFFKQPTTVSLGISSLQGEELKTPLLVEQADRALYQAKCQGRNRAVVFEGWMSQSAHVGESQADSREEESEDKELRE